MHDVPVGCAGWSIPRQHRDLFGEGDSVLARYATRFAVVEINSSFYRSHQAATYARWASSVPRHFRFSVKIPKAISHEMALRGAGPALDRFIGEVAGLGDRLGGFLLQLPPSHALDVRAASTFFRMFRKRSPAPLVCEPRHRSWFSTRAEALFEQHGIGLVAADPAVAADTDRLSLPGASPYWRLHGAPRMYYSDYSDEALRALADVVGSRPRSAPRLWIIFDNTAHGFAVANAARLQHLLRRSR